MSVTSLGYLPRQWQHECHINKQRFTVLALHRRAGKTTLATMELIDKAAQFEMDLGMFVYIAPFRSQAKDIAWAQLKHRLEPLRLAGAIKISEVDLSVQFLHNNATIALFGADNPDAMRGQRIDGAVIDEVAQIRPEVWQDIIQPALSDRKGWALFIGTPNGINLFSELFFKALTLPEWHAARYTVYDTSAIDQEEVERLRRDMPERSFAREYLCDFSAGGDDQLIPLDLVERAATRVYQDTDIELAPRVIGVDPARFGDDRSVIVRRQGLVTFEPAVYNKLDNMQLADKVAWHINDWHPDAVFIDQGAGVGVIDRLRQLNYDVVEVPFGGKASRDDLYSNKRAEIWWEMKEWLEAGGHIPNHQSLKLELATPTYRYDTRGKRMLEAKDQIKKRLQGGGSPDIADALALTFSSPVVKKGGFYQERARRKAQHRDYSPYDLFAKEIVSY